MGNCDRSAAEPDRATWKKAFQLYSQAFREPVQEAEKKKLARILKKPIPQEVIDELFDYEAFLRGLGRMSLSMSYRSPYTKRYLRVLSRPGGTRRSLCPAFTH